MYSKQNIYQFQMEGLVREMQDADAGGVPVRSQKLFLTSIPSAFMGKSKLLFCSICQILLYYR